MTTGGVQSNHARVTAAVAAHLGMRCVLVLNGTPPQVPSGNILLDTLLGAEIHYVGSRAAPTLIPSTSTLTPTTMPNPTITPRPLNTPTPLPDSWLQDLVYTEIPFDELSETLESRWVDGSNYPSGLIEDPTSYYTKMSEENLYYYLQATVPAGDRVWIITCFMNFTWCESAANSPN